MYKKHRTRRPPCPSNLLEGLEPRILLSTVAIAASRPNASEIKPATTGTGRFTLTRNGPLTDPLDVIVAISGTATNTTDYAALTTTIHFDADSAKASVDVVPISDSLAEGQETVILTIVADAAYTINPGRIIATVKINDAASTISVSTSKSNASEANGTTSGAGRFTIKRTGGDLSLPLTVNFTLGGTATEGTDYTAITHSVTFPPGKNSAVVTINPLPDILLEPTETVTLTLAADPSYFINPARTTALLNIANTRLAPDTITSFIANAKIAGGTGDFASTGDFRIIFSSTDNRYLLIGGANVPSSTGTYTYLQITPAVAQLTMDDSILGAIVVTLTFTSPTSATYFISGNGIQTGSITLKAPDSSSFAPDTLAGRTATAIVSSGSAPLVSGGSFHIALGQNSSRYVITGSPGSGNYSGTYAYERFGPNVGLVTIHDDHNGNGWIAVVFSNATNATFLYSLNAGGSQRGTFLLETVPAQTFAPVTFGGHTFISASITLGAPPLPTTGTYTINCSTTNYTLLGGPGIPNSLGTFTYEQLTSVTGLLRLVDADGPKWVVLSFTSTGHANYVLVDDTTGAWQWGIMNLS